MFLTGSFGEDDTQENVQTEETSQTEGLNEQVTLHFVSGPEGRTGLIMELDDELSDCRLSVWEDNA